MKFTDYTRISCQNIQNLEELEPIIEEVSQVLIDCIDNNGTVFFCGNGGSAADSQHLAAEFLGKFLKERKPLSSIALTVDTSAITAIGNDYGYENIFSRQLLGLAKEKDVLVGISTSGKSLNVIKAFEKASEIGVTTIALTGKADSKMSSVCNYAIQVPSEQTNFIQEMHIMIGHYLCFRVEESL